MPALEEGVKTEVVRGDKRRWGEEEQSVKVNRERWNLALLRPPSISLQQPGAACGCSQNRSKAGFSERMNNRPASSAEPLGRTEQGQKSTRKNVMQNCSSVTDWEAESSIQTTQ